MALFYIKQTKQHQNRFTTLQLVANSRTPAELKNCRLENPSLLFGPLAQYLGSDMRWVLSPCITNKTTLKLLHNTSLLHYITKSQLRNFHCRSNAQTTVM